MPRKLHVLSLYVAVCLASHAQVTVELSLGDRMCQAAEEGDLAALMSLAGNSVDTRNTTGQTPLMRAAMMGRREIAIWLVAHGADVNAQSNSDVGSHVLSFATGSKNLGLVTDLIDAGARIDVRAKNFLSPLCCAIDGGSVEIVELLLARGASIDFPGMYTTCKAHKNEIAVQTPLMCAVSRQDAALVGLLIKQGADVKRRALRVDPKTGELTNLPGDSPLIVAILVKNTDIAVTLIAAGADANSRRYDGHSALLLAAVRNEHEIVDLLLAHGADPHATAVDLPRFWEHDAERVAQDRRFYEVADKIGVAKAHVAPRSDSSIFHAGTLEAAGVNVPHRNARSAVPHPHTD